MVKKKVVCASIPSNWLPPTAIDSKCWIGYAKSSLFVTFGLGLILGIFMLFIGRLPLSIVLLAIAVMSLVIVLLVNPLIIKSINDGKFGFANKVLRCFTVIGLFCFIVPGIFFFIAYKKIQPIFKPQTQRYPTNYYEMPRGYPAAAKEEEVEFTPEIGQTLTKK